MASCKVLVLISHEGLDERVAEGNQVRGRPRRDQRPVHDDRRVDELSAGIHQVVFDGNKRRALPLVADGLAVRKPRGAEHPGPVADGCAGLAEFYRRRDGLEHVLIASHVVRGEASWEHQSIDGQARKFLYIHVGLDGVAVFPGVLLPGRVGADDDDLGALLLQS